MKTDEIREKYLEFFANQGHQVCESDVLVPTWDKSVLFTPAGMNPFKDHFLGNVELEFTRATSCQKCLRTGDIENVGRTSYHHTFFEMLGNFSFGDYFKRDAIRWAWEFLTEKRWLGIEADKLTVTVYLDDDEAAGIWENEIGLPTSRIERLDEYENFWPAGAPSDGPDGVCGPCSEIFYHPQGIGQGNDVEIWNLVFTQFNRSGDPPDNLTPLPSKNIDTGMGLERIAATLQGVDTNFHIDTLMPIVQAAAEISGLKYVANSDEGRFLRRITDHIRACTFAIHENVEPGSSKARYVVRRLLRRCTLEGRQRGHTDPFLYQLVPAVIEAMSYPYPELAQSSDRVQQVIRAEEEGFLKTLDDGLDRIERIFANMKSDARTIVDGGEAATLYQTYGIPPELVASMADAQDYQFDWDGFKEAMDQHGDVSGTIADTVMGDFGPIDAIKKEVKSTDFFGYDGCQGEAEVVGLVDGEGRVERLDASDDHSQYLVLDRTPFYAESGGQVADTGKVRSEQGVFEVRDVQKNGDVFVHRGHIVSGTMSVGDSVIAEVDDRRRQAIERAHTATHILHYCLQQTLGTHAQQRGSKVTADWLRFDFSNLEAVGDDVLLQIEQQTKQRIEEAAAVTAETIPLTEAKSQGAMMLFGEKYPDPVRMVSIGDFSKELCGGTHLKRASDVGVFEIVAEESVSSGTRRIEALTGDKAKENQALINETIDRLNALLGVSDSSIPASVNQLIRETKELKKQVSSGKQGNSSQSDVEQGQVLDYFNRRQLLRDLARSLNVATGDILSRVQTLLEDRQQLVEKLTQLASVEQVGVEQLMDAAETVSGINIIVQNVPHSNPNIMRQLIDQLRKQHSPAAVFLATTQGMDKVILVAGVSRELVDKGVRAGDWVKQIAPMVGGGGGGKPDLAQAGGKQPENVPDALKSARDYLVGLVDS